MELQLTCVEWTGRLCRNFGNVPPIYSA